MSTKNFEATPTPSEPISLDEISKENVKDAWKDYEAIQSDIFDHLIAILPEFGLKIYQAPSGYDMQIAMSNP